jgi:hypothetical protein
MERSAGSLQKEVISEGKGGLGESQRHATIVLSLSN